MYLGDDHNCFLWRALHIECTRSFELGWRTSEGRKGPLQSLMNECSIESEQRVSLQSIGQLKKGGRVEG